MDNQLKFEKEIKNLSKAINELHNTLHQLVSAGNEPKKGELRLIRSKIKDSRTLLEFIQKELLAKDDHYQEVSKNLKKIYREKKKLEENG
jgi:hypothetical protein